MRPALRISAFVLITLFIFSLTRCKKNSSGKDQMTEAQQSEFIKFVENEIRTKGVTISVFPDKSEKQGRSAQEEGFCVANFTLDVSRYDYSFTGGCGGGWTDYKGKVWFTITRNNAYPPPTAYGSFVDVYWYITESGNVTPHNNVQFTHVGTTGTTSEYVSDEMDFNGLGHNYCNVTVIANDMEIPPTGCAGGDIPVTQIDGISLTISSFSRCKTLYPAYVNPGGSGSFSFSGWALACYPCQFYPPQEFEFQYRLQGTSNWTTRTENYFLGPYNVNSLSPGTYEYRHRNKVTSPSSCYGPYSDIKTIVVS